MFQMQYLNSAVLMDMISVEFRAQRIAPNPTKSKLFSVLIVCPESSRKLRKIDLACRNKKILGVNAVDIIEDFSTSSPNSYWKLQSVTKGPYIILSLSNVTNRSSVVAFRRSTGTTYLRHLKRAFIQPLPKCKQVKRIQYVFSWSQVTSSLQETGTKVPNRAAKFS